MQKHKWYNEIVAWASGVEIEISRQGMNDWHLIGNDHDWSGDSWEYRIKPQPKEPQYLYVYEDKNGFPILGTNKYSGCIGKIKLENENG